MAHPTADRNFRLSRDVLPSRYEATLTIDPSKQSFHGNEKVDIELSKPSNELVLHALELQVEKAVYRVGVRHWQATSIESVAASETVVLHFAEALPTGEGLLELHWSGGFCKGLRGLYAAGNVSVTQFEAADARRLFPCFDEPNFKARWALSLHVPQELTALGNGKSLDTQADGSGTKRITFEETPPLSSYLVALALGNLKSTPTQEVRGVPVRTWAQPEKLHLAAFGQDVAVNVLPRLEDYFGIPYAFGKVDQVAVPDFEAGAMENAGLITYREVALLLDPNTASLPVQKQVAEVITHELSHQWFGNWVTMVWWDDLWLNEAFATWMAYKIVDQWKPEWRVWLDFDSGKAAALHLDALSSTHPVRADVHNAAEATENFDAITYEKGGAVLRMIEGYLGADRFREGIRAYMKKHGQSNAVADDLWNALAEASKQPVLQLANSWIRQSGYPLVSVHIHGREVKLKQERFYNQPGRHSAEVWPVPLVLRFRDANGSVREQRVLMSESETRVTLEGSGEVAWLCANGSATGFYRVAYDADALARLGKSLHELAPAERVSLLADQWALVRNGSAELGAFLDLAMQFGSEDDYAVLNELVSRLSVIEHRLVSDADRPKLAQVVTKLFAPQLAQVGWEPKDGESDGMRLRRAALLRGLGIIARDEAASAEAKKRLDRFFAGETSALENNLHDVAVVLTARGADSARFDQFLKKFQEERDPAFRRRYLLALAHVEEASLVQRAQQLAFSETVPAQDFASFVATLLGNRVARDGFWAMLQSRWNDVEAKAGGAPMLFRRVIEAMGALPERRHYEAVSSFLAAHPNDVAKAATAQTLERMKQDVELRDRALAPVGAWLRAR
jgi:puromycin-sensitive aminopeptidase